MLTSSTIAKDSLSAVSAAQLRTQPSAQPSPACCFSAGCCSCCKCILHQGAQEDKEKLFNGKQLTTSAASAYKLSTPFVLWGILVVILYAVSYAQFNGVSDHMVVIKLMQRSLAQSTRLTYFATRASLEPVSRSAVPTATAGSCCSGGGTCCQ